MNNEIGIIVTGVAGSGKSAVAMLIAQTLKKEGLNVLLIDENGIGIKDERPGVIEETLHGRLTAVRQRDTEITVTTAFVRRFGQSPA